MAFKLLLIEDEKKISRFLQLELEHEGYQVHPVYDGREGLDAFFQIQPHLVILDLMLPSLNGMEVCRRIRQKSNIPILMLTAKGETMDKVMGFDTGADDYMTKPFEIEELLARIRRKLATSQPSDQNPKNVFLNGGLKVLKDAHRAYYEETEIELTKKEFQLLLYLMENEDRVLTREQILNTVWGYDFIGDTNIVDVYIRYLRSKIDNVHQIKLIHTVWGVGYVIKKEV